MAHLNQARQPQKSAKGREERAARVAARRREIVLFTLLFLLIVALAFAGCADKKTAVKDFDADENTSFEASVRKGAKPQPDPEVAVIETADYGNIAIELYSNIAPEMVGRFRKLIKEAFYDGTTFHRINPQAGIIQGGDPFSKDNDPVNDGMGDSPYPNVRGEFSDVPYERGIVGAARRGATPALGGRAGLTEAAARDTANCQFFITLKRQPAFDKKYTIFGRVINGINNAEIIMGAPTEEGTERPAEKIVVKSVTLQPRSKYVPAS
jgi:peptidyl-prolyl cis-trans isomerase B (cyclophilin B)